MISQLIFSGLKQIKSAKDKVAGGGLSYNEEGWKDMLANALACGRVCVSFYFYMVNGLKCTINKARMSLKTSRQRQRHTQMERGIC